MFDHIIYISFVLQIYGCPSMSNGKINGIKLVYKKKLESFIFYDNFLMDSRSKATMLCDWATVSPSTDHVK
jgi:hypothetical protein